MTNSEFRDKVGYLYRSLPQRICIFSTIITYDTMSAHPLSALSPEEATVARDAIVASYPDTIVYFREIYLFEPPKAELREFLALEHSGRLSPTTPRPPRLALCQYDVIDREKVTEYHESVVDVRLRRRVKNRVVDKKSHAALVVYAERGEWTNGSMVVLTGLQ